MKNPVSWLYWPYFKNSAATCSWCLPQWPVQRDVFVTTEETRKFYWQCCGLITLLSTPQLAGLTHKLPRPPGLFSVAPWNPEKKWGLVTVTPGYAKQSTPHCFKDILSVKGTRKYIICSYLREFCQSPQLLQLHEKLLHGIKAGLDSHLDSSKKNNRGRENTRQNFSICSEVGILCIILWSSFLL